MIIDVGDVYAEGMLMAGLKLYERGVRNEALVQMFRYNSASDQLIRDIEAQVASAQLGARRFKELLTRYGKDFSFTAINQLIDYAETIMRQQIAQIPDGDYRAEGFLDDDGRNRERRLPVVVTVKVSGDALEVDLTGSALQTETAYNVPFEGSWPPTPPSAAAARRCHAAQPGAVQRGVVPPDQRRGAAGHDFQPSVPSRCRGALHPVQPDDRSHHQALAPVLPGG